MIATRTPMPLQNELERLAALHNLGLMDSAPEESYDRITRLVALALRVEVALVSLVDQDRQWFKSRVGFTGSETPRSVSFCSHVVAAGAPMMITDASNDVRFADNPLVTGEPHIRAYFGMPLRTRQGFTIGALCAVDSRVRTLSAEETEMLASCAQIVQELIQAREISHATDAVLEFACDRDRLFSDTFEQTAVGMAHLSTRGQVLRANTRLCEMLGYGGEEMCTMLLSDITHSEDLDAQSQVLGELVAGIIKTSLFEVRYRCKSRQLIWTEMSLALGRNTSDGAAYLIAAVTDISERKKAEADLSQIRATLQDQVKQQTAQLREANEALSQQVAKALEKEQEARDAISELKHLHYALDQQASVSVTNVDGTITYVNDRFCNEAGYSAEELIGRSYANAWELEGLWSTILSGAIWHGEVCKSKKSGEKYWVDESVVPYRDDGGRIVKFVCIRIDITQRKLHEKLLADEERKSRAINQRLRQITDNVPALISYWDRDLICRFANKSHFERFGRTASECVGMSYTELLGKSLDEANREHVIAALNGERRTFELADEHADGSIVYLQIDYVPDRQDGNVVGFYALVVNITLLKSTEARLLRQESMLAATGRMGEIGGWELERDVTRPIWSDMVYEIHDLPVGEIIDLHGMFAFFPDDGRLKLIKAVQDAFCEAKPFDVVLPFVTAKGRHRWIRTIGEPQVNDGVVVRITGAFQDITHQKQFETDVAHAQKLESIGQLSAGIAHEINTPTQFIGNNVGFIKESLGDVTLLLTQVMEIVRAPTDAAAAIEDVLRAMQSADLDYLLAEIPRAIEQSVEGIERIKRIVGAMKDFSHPGLDKTLIDINRAIQSTIVVASNEWKYVANVEAHLDEELQPVAVIPGSFNQVILNIVVNAAHAVADAVEGTSQKGTITVTTRQVEKWVEISIQDSGCGIPANIRERIFDPFFTTKPVGKGTGQGLAIAHDVIVKKHGGTIAVESAVDVGTTFILRLPLVTNDVDARSDV